MPRRSYVAKPQQIGERLTCAMAEAHMDRRALAEPKASAKHRSCSGIAGAGCSTGPSLQAARST
jgi:hypothetical protein